MTKKPVPSTEQPKLLGYKKNPRLNARGHEILDSRPTVLFMEIDGETGEVLQPGIPRPLQAQAIHDRAIARHLELTGHGYDDDDAPDPDEDDGSLPIYTPFTEGFAEHMGISEAEAVKWFKKRGIDPDAPPKAPPSSTDEGAPAPKEPAGDPSPQQ